MRYYRAAYYNEEYIIIEANTRRARVLFASKGLSIIYFGMELRKDIVKHWDCGGEKTRFKEISKEEAQMEIMLG